MTGPPAGAGRKPATPLVFVVYSRQGCHLCEQLCAELEELAGGRASISVLDVDSCAQWWEAYSDRVPVVCCDGDEICQYNLDRRAVLERIAANDG